RHVVGRQRDRRARAVVADQTKVRKNAGLRVDHDASVDPEDRAGAVDGDPAARQRRLAGCSDVVVDSYAAGIGDRDVAGAGSGERRRIRGGADYQRSAVVNEGDVAGPAVARFEAVDLVDAGQVDAAVGRDVHAVHDERFGAVTREAAVVDE